MPPSAPTLEGGAGIDLDPCTAAPRSSLDAEVVEAGVAAVVVAGAAEGAEAVRVDEVGGGLRHDDAALEIDPAWRGRTDDAGVEVLRAEDAAVGGQVLEPGRGAGDEGRVLGEGGGAGAVFHWRT